MEWKKTNKRFVGFFDIMGFKDLVQRHSHDYVYDKLYKIRDFVNFYEKHDETIKKIESNHKKSTVRHILFSDSILIISNGDTEIDAEHLINHCNHFIWNCFLNEIPIMGGLSH